ncbi:MAG: DUF1559 domain-containing protein [Pirellulales bacterium]|nr:DUF1559 domain-containing protein [Pirellulales bacterium]
MNVLSRKRGLTLVEVLTVIGVLGIALCVLLMALPRWRESARRANCTNNMKNIGLGLLNYENQHKFLPGSAEVVKSDPLRPVGGWSFLFKILRNMEYDTIYDSINPANIESTILPPGAPGTLTIPLTSMGTAPPGGGSGLNAIAYARDTQICEFLCPCNPNMIFEWPCAPNSPLGTKHAVTNYKAMCSAFYPGFATNTGTAQQYTGTVTVPKGAYTGLYRCDGGLYPTNAGIRLSDLSDGASCTILCGETMDYTASSWIAGSDVNMVAIPTTIQGGQTGGPIDLVKWQNSFFALPGFNGQYYGRGGTRAITTFFSMDFGIVGKNIGQYELDPLVAPCQAGTRYAQPSLSRTYEYGPSSGHPGVINCLFGDGSVRPVRKDVDASALFFAVTRNNNDPAANDKL